MLEVIAHHFVGGVYCKEMSIPEDYQVVSHKHAYDHMSVLTSGCVIVEADGEQETYWSPAIINIKAGVEHSVIAVNGPAHWLCIHATDCTDIEKVDEVLIEKQKHMVKQSFSIPVHHLGAELKQNFQLWNEFDFRTKNPTSPHRDISDIIVRCRKRSDYDENQPQAFTEQHDSVWYDSYYALPSLEWIVAQLHNQLGQFELGGVLLTKIPPGKQVFPHSDAGTWHSDYYTEKVLVLVKSAPGQQFCFEGETHEGEAGDVFIFNNHPTHWVVNNSDTDRISLILAIKRFK